MACIRFFDVRCNGGWHPERSISDLLYLYCKWVITDNPNYDFSR